MKTQGRVWHVGTLARAKAQEELLRAKLKDVEHQLVGCWGGVRECLMGAIESLANLRGSTVFILVKNAQSNDS